MQHTHTHVLTLLGGIASWKLKGYHKSALQSWCRATDPKDAYSNDFFCSLWGVLCLWNNDSAGLRLSHLAKAEADKEKQTEKEKETEISYSPLVPFFLLSFCKLFCMSSTSLRIFTMKTKVNLLQFLHFSQFLSTFIHSTLIKWFPWKWQSIVAWFPLCFKQRELFYLRT